MKHLPVQPQATDNVASAVCVQLGITRQPHVQPHATECVLLAALLVLVTIMKKFHVHLPMTGIAVHVLFVLQVLIARAAQGIRLVRVNPV